jgi:serine/threonine protein kinase
MGSFFPAERMVSHSSQALSRFVGPYEVLEKLGVGGMGSVYKARHRHTEALVAVKIASRRVLNEPILLQRFQYEYEAAQHLQHPRLVRALEHGYAGGAPYLVMEYVAGKSLDKHIQERGKLPWNDVRCIIQQIGDALDYIHQHGVIHRDIKPGNILVAEGGDVKLADLGLVKNLHALRHMTRSATGLGTVEFSAPEQFEDAKNADERADIYSLAATAYLALTGEYPFGRGGQIKILRRKLANDIVPLAQLAPYLPPVIEEVLFEGMRAEPTERPGSVHEFVQRLCGPELPTLPGQPAAGVALNHADRRGGKRIPVRIESTCRLLTRADVQVPAVIQDLSVNGLCVRCPRRFEVGTVLRVELISASVPHEFVAQVRWVKSFRPNTWLVGCHFTNALAPAELEMLCFNSNPKTRIVERVSTRH